MSQSQVASVAVSKYHLMLDPGQDECGHEPILAQRIIKPRSRQLAVDPINGIIQHQGPKSPKYVSLEARVASFQERWPPGLNQKPDQLAEAGFFYYGVGDQVLCFYCDGGMHKWDPSDQPWTEHAKWFPECGYLILKKGAAFVESVQKEFNSSRDDSGFNSLTPSEDSDLDLDARTTDSLEPPGENILEPTGLTVQSYKSDTMANPKEVSSVEDRLGMVSLSGKPNACASNKMPKRELSTEEILEENRKLREDRLCKICLDHNKEVIFIPCGHYLACLNCGLSFQTCPVCRAKISSIVKTYMT